MIKELEEELRGLVKSVPTFSNNGFSIFDLDDFNRQREGGHALPCAGIGYNGAVPVQGNEVRAENPSARAAVMVDGQFLVVVAVEYGYTALDDHKPSAFDLLDQVRTVVNGYKGVNTRPWRFISERPEPEASGDGVLFYSQVWHTAFVSAGNFNQT